MNPLAASPSREASEISNLRFEILGTIALEGRAVLTTED